MQLEFENPFRWDITRQEQLGRLLGEKPLTTELPLHTEFLPCCAKIISYAHDSDLVFVGRSLENFFDYFSGLFYDISWFDRLKLLQFSMRYNNEAVVREKYRGAILAIRHYLKSLGLDPKTIASRNRSVAFIDLVYEGYTFESLINLFYNWCKEIQFDWKAVNRRLYIVGVTQRSKNSPNAFRWQQQVAWLTLLPSSRVKNISLNVDFWSELGDKQAKLTPSYYPARWGKEDLTHPNHDKQHIEALHYAYALFNKGRQHKERLAFIKQLGKQTAIKYNWFRSLIAELQR